MLDIICPYYVRVTSHKGSMSQEGYMSFSSRRFSKRKIVGIFLLIDIEKYSIIYSVFFFIELRVFVNLTYLYLSEIKKQGLIFSVGMGNLIICQKNLDLDRGFLSKPVFLLYACRASVEL